MNRDPWERRRKAKLAVMVIAVGLTISALLAVALFYIGQTRPSF
jgi:hypothetical protein